MPMKTYKGKEPVAMDNVRIFEGAMVIGDVRLGKNTGVWFNATIRGDMDRVEIGENTNVQDNAVIHTDSGEPTAIGKNVTIGHGAIIHAATVGDGALIGMGSIILNNAEIGEEALIGAGTVVPPGKKVPPRSLAVGNPMKVVKELTDEDISRIHENAGHYVALKDTYQ